MREEKCEVKGRGKREKERQDVLKAATLFISQSFFTFLVSVWFWLRVIGLVQSNAAVYSQ